MRGLDLHTKMLQLDTRTLKLLDSMDYNNEDPTGEAFWPVIKLMEEATGNYASQAAELEILSKTKRRGFCKSRSTSFAAEFDSDFLVLLTWKSHYSEEGLRI
ncbi:hypothetical protein MUK42_34748 [Musa troglodytarum]|uniref:Uncharacterized protein n=1 Tax=Musa troglodytarum TaxID=320322 RepID=A0A9E7K6N8_9LILI|nr:hypothetical protein MUK42_34748 [Musa troglodytarum]